MTTNIKLIENWIAEEEAAETPIAPVAAAPTAPAVKLNDFVSQNIIGESKQIKVTLSGLKPFDITKSTLTVVGVNLFESVKFTYDSSSKTWKSADTAAFNAAAAALTPIKDRSKAKKSLAGIILDSLALAGAPTAWNYNPNIASNTAANTVDRLVAAGGTTSLRGIVPADAAQISSLAGIGSTPITNLSVITEVNIDTLSPTGKFNIIVNNNYVSGAGFASISDNTITKVIGSQNTVSSTNPVVKQKITAVLTDLIAKSKIEAVKPI